MEYNELLIPTRYGLTYALESGDHNKPVIILLHAMGFNSLVWAENVIKLSTYYRVITLDTIGDQGRSPVRRDYPSNGLDYADWICDIINVISKDQKVVIAGCSMGGWIALSTALYYPEKVSALILNSPAAGIPVKTTWMKYLNDIIFTTSEKRHRNAARYLLGNGKAAQDWEDYMVRVVADVRGAKIGTPTDYKIEELRNISCPVQILIGENEVIYNEKKELFSIAEKIWEKNLYTAFIPSAGHMGHYDNPVFFNNSVIEFLRTNSIY